LIMFHTRALLAAGLTAPKHHAWAKPMVVERECVHRVCAMAEAAMAQRRHRTRSEFNGGGSHFRG
ncbi:MAG: hypothetical protein EBX37_17930, partial [Alphaproteobacteria bacterium]|nr:hypothetical protein [Alphaproteobacteria bacterium]